MKRILLLAIAACPLGAQPSGPVWTLSSRPTLDIGSEENPQTQFNGVNGILRLSTGEIVVANGRSQELRVFSPAGQFLRTLSSDGLTVRLRSLDQIWRGAGDTIYAAEIAGENNVWAFTRDAAVGKRTVGAPNAGGVYPIGRFPDGRYAVSAAPRRSTQTPTGLTFLELLPLGVLSLDDLTPKWIGSLRTEMLILPSMGRGRGNARTPVQYPYGRTTAHAVSADRLWIGDSESGTVTQYASSGRGLTVFTAPIAARALDTALIRRLRMSLLQDAMSWNDRVRVDASYSLPFPEKAPRFSRFLAGVDGEVWIELFREDFSAPRAYVVVNREGAAIGRVTMPPRVVPFEIGRSDLLAVRFDEDGVEHVVRYTLRRAAR